MRNGISFRNIMSAVRVIILFCSFRSHCIEERSVTLKIVPLEEINNIGYGEVLLSTIVHYFSNLANGWDRWGVQELCPSASASSINPPSPYNLPHNRFDPFLSSNKRVSSRSQTSPIHSLRPM